MWQITELVWKNYLKAIPMCLCARECLVQQITATETRGRLFNIPKATFLGTEKDSNLNKVEGIFTERC